MKALRAVAWAVAVALALSSWLAYIGFYDRLGQARGKIYRVTHGGAATAGVAELQGQLQTLELENQRLRKMLQLPRQGWKLSVTANCLYRDGSGPDSDLWLDRGQVDGVSLRTVALHSSGLVGRVVEVEARRSRLRPVLSRQSRVPVVLGGSGLQGVAQGRGWVLEVSQVRSRPEVEAGAWVTTSGLGQVYPGSVLVGQIIRPLPSSEPMFARYEVEPSVFLDQVLEVLLVEVQEKSP